VSVSIITRTLGRDCLADAAAAVAAQTLAPLEWVVVDAAGEGLAPPPAGAVPVRVVSTGTRLPRSRAANAGLDAARGDRLLVLDDDDLIAPAHLEHLALALDANPSARVAYSDWEALEAPDSRVGGHAPAFSPLLLARRNLFPPHAALFDARLVRDAGCRFDETLEYFEDWDFWLALARHGPFVHSPGCTATYRTFLSQSGIHGHGQGATDPRIDGDHGRIRARYREDTRRLEDAQAARKAAARDAYRRADLPRAAEGWSAAHLADPDDAEPIAGYADVAVRAGDLVTARAILGQGLARLPGRPALAERLAEVEARLASGPPAE